MGSKSKKAKFSLHEKVIVNETEYEVIGHFETYGAKARDQYLLEDDSGYRVWADASVIRKEE